LKKSDKILDDHLLLEGFKKETFLEKRIRKLFLLCSTILILMDCFYFYVWNLKSQYLGYSPSYSATVPEHLAGMDGINRYVKLYEFADESCRYLIMIFFAMIPLLISFLYQIQKEKNKLVLVYGILATAMSSYLIFGGFISWLLD